MRRDDTPSQLSWAHLTPVLSSEQGTTLRWSWVVRGWRADVLGRQMKLLDIPKEKPAKNLNPKPFCLLGPPGYWASPLKTQENKPAPQTEITATGTGTSSTMGAYHSFHHSNQCLPSLKQLLQPALMGQNIIPMPWSYTFLACPTCREILAQFCPHTTDPDFFLNKAKSQVLALGTQRELCLLHRHVINNSKEDPSCRS